MLNVVYGCCDYSDFILSHVYSFHAFYNQYLLVLLTNIDYFKSPFNFKFSAVS